MMSGLVLAWTAPQWDPVDGGGALDTMTLGAMTLGIGGASLTLTVLYFAANQLMTNFQALRMPGARTLQ